uniref:NADH-ubiquinone oxidoreductase chain 2 n=1 Tax=Morchella brunnea TaxID=1174671 RepID=A0A8K1I7X3_9PEZI|nr:NADH dehydrogenase subunit 2 [Morchella brunnea]UBU98380.1 NADH dehydrogenase subunit 2 [Morchella brunnea]
MLFVSITLLLLVNAVTLRRERSIFFNRLAILILLYSGIIGYDSLYIKPLDTGIGIYGGLFHTTSITHSFNLFISILGAIVLLLTAFYPRRFKEPYPSGEGQQFFLIPLSLASTGARGSQKISSVFTEYSKYTYSYLEIYKNKIISKMGEQFTIIEYPLIILFVLIGATFLMSSSDLVSMFLAIELQSYGLYIFATLYRDSELATSAGLTYFLLGGLSSCFILLGSCLLYLNSGITNLDGIYVLSSLSEVNGKEAIVETNKYLNLALLIMSVGYLFKVSAAPFHFWSPDVYDSLATSVTIFVATIPKISLFIFLLELVHYAGLSMSEFSWINALLLSSLLSLIVGSIVGLVQYRIKRLLAYSTISHVGFLLLALAVNSVESIQGFLFYLMQYSLTNINVFFIIILIGYSLTFVENNSDKHKLLDYYHSPLQHISQLKGYFHLNPLLSLSLAVCIFSFVGIPPLVGFFGKQMVLSAALQNGYVFLALVAILTSVVSAAYYLNIIKEIFFNKSNYTIGPVYHNTHFSSSLTITISVLTLVILLFIISPTEWLSTASILALNLFNT